MIAALLLGLKRKSNSDNSVKKVAFWFVNLINAAAMAHVERMLGQAATTEGLSANKTAIPIAVTADRSIPVTDLGKRVTLDRHVVTHLASKLVAHGFLEYSRLGEGTVSLKPTERGHAVARQILRSLQRPK